MFLKNERVDQESVIHSLWANSSPLFVFMNKVLLEHRNSHLFMGFLLSTTELRSCGRNCLVCKTKNIFTS